MLDIPFFENLVFIAYSPLLEESKNIYLILVFWPEESQELKMCYELTRFPPVWRTPTLRSLIVRGRVWCGLLWNIKTRIEDTGFPDEDNLFSSYHDHKFLIQNITYPKCLEPTWPRPASNSCQLAFHHLILRFQTHHHQAESLMATWDSLNKLSQSASRKPQAKHSSLMKLCAEQMDIDDPDILD